MSLIASIRDPVDGGDALRATLNLENLDHRSEDPMFLEFTIGVGEPEL